MTRLTPDDGLLLSMIGGVGAFHFKRRDDVSDLAARGLIESCPTPRNLPPSAPRADGQYWRITEAGRAALKEEEGRT